MQNQPVVSNTHIYINAPVNSISIGYRDVENDPSRNRVFLKNDYPQTYRNYGESTINCTESENVITKETVPEIKVEGYPLRKYERVTKKLFDLPGEERNFNFDQYRNFVNKVSISTKLTQITHQSKE
jgi:hypothetical protein